MKKKHYVLFPLQTHSSISQGADGDPDLVSWAAAVIGPWCHREGKQSSEDASEDEPRALSTPGVWVGAAECSWVQLWRPWGLAVGTSSKMIKDAGCGRFVLLVIIGVRVYARFLSDTLGCTGILLQHIPWQACTQQRAPGALHFARGARTKLHRQYGGELGHDATPLAMSVRFPVTSCMTPWYQYDTNMISCYAKYDQITLDRAAGAEWFPLQKPKACWTSRRRVIVPTWMSAWKRWLACSAVISAECQAYYFKDLQSHSQSMRIHENSWISRSIQRRLPAKPSPIHLNRVRRSKVSLWRRYAKNI